MAGDLFARPGTEPIAPPAATRKNGNGNGHGNGSAGKAPPVAAPPAESAGFVYDDGFGAMPLETIEGEEEYGIEEPLEEGSAIAQGLGRSRAFTATPEYPGASSFVEARHFRRPNQPRTINRIVIHITDGHGPARGTADYFSDPQRWYRVDEEDGQLQMEMEGDRCARFRTGGKWKDCVNARTKVQGGRTIAGSPASQRALRRRPGRRGDPDGPKCRHRLPRELGQWRQHRHRARCAQAEDVRKGRRGVVPERRPVSRLGPACLLAGARIRSPEGSRSHPRPFRGRPGHEPHGVPKLGLGLGPLHDVADGRLVRTGASFRACGAELFGRKELWARLRGCASARALSGESFAVFWNDVELVAQMTNMSCWAASASMVVGWRDQISIDPQEIANGTGVWGAYKNGLWPRDHAALADAWGLVKEPPQSYSVEGWRQLLEQNGPLWIGVAVPSGHAVVVTGLFGDGTPEGTTVRFNDPWPPGQGAEKQTKSFAAFIREYENRISTNGDRVNVQVIHAGGGGGRQASTTQSYAGALEFTAFDPSAVDRMRQEFEANVGAGSPKSCIIITNAALRKLYGPALKNSDGTDKALATTIQDTMAKLASYGLAQSPKVFEFNDARGRLTKGVMRPEMLRESVEAWIPAGQEQVCALYVFGLSIMDGYHSVTLAFDFAGVGDPLTRLYWADQIYSGWDDVTGTLDARITERTQAWWDPLPADRKARTRVTVWPLLPGEIQATTHGFSAYAPRRPSSRPFTTEGEEGIEGMEEESAIVSTPQSEGECTDAFCPVGKTAEASTEHFTVEEFRCRDGTEVPERFRGNVQEVMNNLEVLRAELGLAITVNSGYRTCSYNSTLEGAASKSRHLCGQAADIRVAEHTPAQVHAAIERLIAAKRMKEGGLGLYNTFVHYDVRGTKVRWDRTTRSDSALAMGVVVRRALPFSAPAPGSNPGSTAAAALSEAGAFAAAPTTGAFQLSHPDVASRLTALVNNPNAIDQSKLNLCGPAAYFNILLRRDPVSFTRYAVDLFKTGSGTIGGLSVEPGSDLRAQTYQSAWGCPTADWMTMSALRDSENAFTDYEGTPEETISAATTPAELAAWLAATGLYTLVSDEGNWVFTKGVSHATGLAPGPSTDVALLINAHILGNAAAAKKKSDEFILSAFPNHFVVLKTPIVERAGMIEFQCWTWGSIYSVSVNRDTFDANYYGAVIATV